MQYLRMHVRSRFGLPGDSGRRNFASLTRKQVATKRKDILSIRKYSYLKKCINFENKEDSRSSDVMYRKSLGRLVCKYQYILFNIPYFILLWYPKMVSHKHMYIVCKKIQPDANRSDWLVCCHRNRRSQPSRVVHVLMVVFVFCVVLISKKEQKKTILKQKKMTMGIANLSSSTSPSATLTNSGKTSLSSFHVNKVFVATVLLSVLINVEGLLLLTTTTTTTAATTRTRTGRTSNARTLSRTSSVFRQQRQRQQQQQQQQLRTVDNRVSLLQQVNDQQRHPSSLSSTSLYASSSSSSSSSPDISFDSELQELFLAQKAEFGVDMAFEFQQEREARIDYWTTASTTTTTTATATGENPNSNNDDKDHPQSAGFFPQDPNNKSMAVGTPNFVTASTTRRNINNNNGLSTSNSSSRNGDNLLVIVGMSLAAALSAQQPAPSPPAQASGLPQLGILTIPFTLFVLVSSAVMLLKLMSSD